MITCGAEAKRIYDNFIDGRNEYTVITTYGKFSGKEKDIDDDYIYLQLENNEIEKIDWNDIKEFI